MDDILAEPDWEERFPDPKEPTFHRDLHAFWSTVVPVLSRFVALDWLDAEHLKHAAFAWAFAVQCERELVTLSELTDEQRAATVTDVREPVRSYLHDLGVSALGRKQRDVPRVAYRELDDLLARIEKPGGTLP
jgi:hypothetical protein